MSGDGENYLSILASPTAKYPSSLSFSLSLSLSLSLSVSLCSGLLIRSVIQAQAASHTFTHVYAALVAIINTKFPQIGELLAKRLILQFRKGFRRNDKV